MVQTSQKKFLICVRFSATWNFISGNIRTLPSVPNTEPVGYSDIYCTAVLTIFLFVLLGAKISFAQTTFTLVSATGDGAFENATSTFAANNWTPVGTSARTWRVGTFGGAATGTKAAYWGTATAYGGSAASAVGHFYKDIIMLVRVTINLKINNRFIA